MHNVFISYHHDNDQFYKNRLLSLGSRFSAFVDRSVDTGDICENRPMRRSAGGFAMSTCAKQR